MGIAEPALSRKEREKIQHRQDIMDAALELFSERGYHDVTMQEIASKAEFGTGTLYNFFASKKELFGAIILDKTEGFVEEGLRLFSLDAEPEAILRRYIRTKPKLFWERKQFIHLFYMVSNGFEHSGHEELDAVVQEHIHNIHTQLTKTLNSGMEAGVFRELDIPSATRVITDTVIAFSRRAIEEDVFDEKALNVTEDILLAGLLK